MPDIHFACPHCQQRIKAETGYAGLQITCPACGNGLAVPPPPFAPAPPSGTTLKRVLILSGIGVVLLGVGGYFGRGMIQRSRANRQTMERPVATGRDVGQPRTLGESNQMADATDPGGAGEASGRSGPQDAAPAEAAATAAAMAAAKEDTQTVAEEKEPPVTAPSHTLEIQQARIPESKVNGMISGTNFVAAVVRLEKTADGYVLTLRQGFGPTPDRAVQVFLRLGPNQGPTNLNLTVSREMKASVAMCVTKTLSRSSRAATQTQSYSTGYALRLELGSPIANAIPGRLYLALPDTERSVVAGAFIAALPAFGLGGVQNAEDWPQWRGPLRNGLALVSPPLLNRWPAEGPRQLWQSGQVMHGGKGTGYSSPIVAGDRVYLYGYWLDPAAASGAYDGVACLDAASGALLWHETFPVDRKKDPRWQSSTPCVAGGRVYVWGSSQAYCFDGKDGRVIWQKAVGHATQSSSFAVVDGVAVLVCGGFLGLDALTGQTRWHRSEQEFRWPNSPSPVCWHHDGKNYTVCSCKSVGLVDPTAGEVLWNLPWGHGTWTSATGSWKGNSTPAIAGDWMVVTQTDDGATMSGYALSLEGATKRWTVPHHDSASSPLIYQGYVYTVGGGNYGKPTSIRCVELQTGTVKWEERTFPQGCSSPIAVDGKILAYLKFGKLLCMWKADPSRCTLLATASVQSDGYSSLAFSKGHLFVRLHDGVACYDLASPAQR